MNIKIAVIAAVSAGIGAVCALQLGRMVMSKPVTKGPIFADVPIARPVENEVVQGSLPDFRIAAKKIINSVVSIDAVGMAQGWMGYQEVADSGSGVLISKDGYIVTNAHVVQAGDRTDSITVHFPNGASYDAKVIGVDDRADLAVLKIDGGNDLQPAVIGKSSELEVGEWVLAVGNPFRQENTVSAGIVGNLGRDVPTSRTNYGYRYIIDAIQTDASINPGNSGGALANAKGELVGFNTAILSPSQTSAGIGFAIPIDRAKLAIEDLIKYGRARYGRHGLTAAPRPGLLKNDRVREQYKQETGFEPPNHGALVITVEPDSPAQKAGIKMLDVILKVGNREVADQEDFIKYTYNLRPGESLNLTIFSGGKTVTKTFTLDELTNL